MRLLFAHVLALLLVAACSGIGFAASPDRPAGESPEDGSSGAPAGVQLCVDVSDPDGDSLDVVFWGRRVYGEEFSIIALPDTQYYSRDNPAIFNAQTQWIVDNKQTRNIVFTTHLGDIVQTGDNATQWNRADTAMSFLEDPETTGLLDGIAYGLAPGNHDQAPRGSPRGSGEGTTTTLFNQHFGVHRFEGRGYYGGHYDFGDPGLYSDNNDNNYELFTAGDMDFLYIHLEFDNAPSSQRDAVLNWMDNLLLTHPDRRVLITTHYLISQFAIFSDQGSAIYERVKDNPNVFLMHGGHITGGARRTDLYQSNVIYSLLADYQGWANGGNGYLRIMTFVPAADEIRVETYSPWIDQYDHSAAHEFTLEYPMVSPLPWGQVGGTVRNVPSGGRACVPWTGRRDGVRYEWFAEVSDGESGTTGATWRFSSDGGCTLDEECVDQDRCTEDLCDSGRCRDTAPFDGDHDGVCEADDNCPRRPNPLQRNADGDDLGDLCDPCPDDWDVGLLDSDADGADDVCDCQVSDGNDRRPGEIAGVRLEKPSEGTTRVTWDPAAGADSYSVTRGLLSALTSTDLGDCFREGLFDNTLDDEEAAPAGDGHFYLVQGENYDCSIGPLGYDSDELPRENLAPLACEGSPYEDARAISEETVLGTVAGSMADTMASDDVDETISEVVSGVSRAEHRWTIPVTSGRKVEFHVEAYHKLSGDGDNFEFEYSTDGGASWLPLAIPVLPTADPDADFVTDLPPALSGDVLFRVIDTNHTSGLFLDWVAIDDLFVRTIY